MKKRNCLRYFSPFEWGLWMCSVGLILLSFFLGEKSYPMTFIASLVGVSALIFIAKGNVIGQFLVIIFSTLYAVVSWQQRYYGEMITYLGMSLPSAIVACITWLKNPSDKGASEVKIARMSARKWTVLSLSAIFVTGAFYFILQALNTNNLFVSTLSVTTSFFAAMLLILRNPFYAIGYAANDLVLITLWTFSALKNLSYLPMVFCFLAFLINDLYGFFNWKRMQKRQNPNG